MAVKNGYAKNGYVAIAVEGLEAVRERPPSEPAKTAVAAVLVLCAWLLNDVALALVHDRVPYGSPPLPDLWFAFLPEMTRLIGVAELILVYSLLLTLATALLHTHRCIVVRRMLIIFALAYTGRAVCVSLTQVPVPSPKTYCSPVANHTSAGLIASRAFGAFVRLGVDLNGRSLCGDLIYSGHTLLLTICHLMVSRYTPRRLRWLSWTTAAGTSVAIVCILMARKHYTVDVVIGYYVASRIFYNYHALLELTLRKAELELSLLDRLLWYPLFSYSERNVTSRLPNTMSFGTLFPR